MVFPFWMPPTNQYTNDSSFTIFIELSQSVEGMKQYYLYLFSKIYKIYVVHGADFKTVILSKSAIFFRLLSKGFKMWHLIILSVCLLYVNFYSVTEQWTHSVLQFMEWKWLLEYRRGDNWLQESEQNIRHS